MDASFILPPLNPWNEKGANLLLASRSFGERNWGVVPAFIGVIGHFRRRFKSSWGHGGKVLDRIDIDLVDPITDAVVLGC